MSGALIVSNVALAVVIVVGIVYTGQPGMALGMILMAIQTIIVECARISSRGPTYAPSTCCDDDEEEDDE